MININNKKMCPRSYNLGKRRASAIETRVRILEALRKLLANESSPSDLSMEAVAREANLSRLTIYYQFKSRRGLLEALYDYLANRGNMQQMTEVFRDPNPQTALEKLVRTFVQFWASDPVVIRRLRAISALDSEIGEGIRARDSRRVHAANEILRRMNRHSGEQAENNSSSVSVILAMLTSFETYDALSNGGYDNESIVRTLIMLAQAAIQ